MTCRQYVVMADQSISISYAEPGQGGQPYLFLTTADATSLGLCGLGGIALSTGGSGTGSSGSTSANSNAKSGGGSSRASSSAALSMVAPHPAVFGAGVLILVVAGAFGQRFA